MIDIATPEAALVGYQAQHDQITAKMAEIRKSLGTRLSGRGGRSTPFARPAPKKRVLSAAARKRIGAAQKKRWAAFHKRNAKNPKETAKKTPAKKKMSAARKAALVANLKKARAAKADKALATTA